MSTDLAMPIIPMIKNMVLGIIGEAAVVQHAKQLVVLWLEP